MDGNSVHKPLLSSQYVEPGYVERKPLLVSLAKWVLRTVMWAVFISWAAFIFLYPSKSVSELFRKLIGVTNDTVFGTTGSLFLVFSAPILLVAFLSAAYLVISGEEEAHKKKTSQNPRFRLWTFPVVVDGPFGVISAAELIGILLFAVYVICAVYTYTMQILSSMTYPLPLKLKSCLFLEIFGLRLGSIGMFCLGFLFLPVARGSVLLRLIDIPFEHATRYHVWLGHLTLVLFTLHGLCYVIAWGIEGNLLHQIMEWKDIGVANFAGVISLLAGLLMWVTSLAPVRKLNFELFFYTHQLYIVFVVFLALHVGDFIFCMAAGGIFLFMLDRFLRFCQSRRIVKIISAKCLPCGTVELVLSKPANLQYNALSFIFLQIRELSWLQWHPFSVSSSPLDGKHHLSILIKVLGQWTSNLRGNIINNSETEPEKQPPFRPHTELTASVEGPYGHELPYHLMYENLILVAGGIGLSPFLAILSDILHRVREGKPCLPRNLLIIWAVKKSNELPLLSTIDMESICPFFSNKLNIETRIYVTRESEPPLEEGKVQNAVNSYHCPMPKSCGMSVLVGTGHKVWSGLYIISSTVGFIILMGLLDIFYINPYSIHSWWYKGLLFMVCMAASIVIFGGFVIALWHLWEKRTSAEEECEEGMINVDQAQHDETVTHKNLRVENPANCTTIQYGSRPDFAEIFGWVSKNWGHVDVGVIVCGPPTLQSSVAKEISTLGVGLAGEEIIEVRIRFRRLNVEESQWRAECVEWREGVRKWAEVSNDTVFGTAGKLFVLFSAPIILIALLSVAYLIISGEEEVHKKKTSQNPRFRLWTFPVFVEGPFGVVSAAELVGILLFAVFVVLSLCTYIMQILGSMSDQSSLKLISYSFWEDLGLRFASVGILCLGFLFLPIARGSVLLRLIDIPFEHAVRYHVWMGHLTMLLFTLHGLSYVIAWTIEGNLQEKIMEWENIGFANFAGVISLSAGLLMWVTSLYPVRKQKFELFFYTHQLYIVFVIFLAMHVGDYLFCMAAGGIFLFMLDRFLRFCQSRRTVKIISAKCLPCGTVELILSKPSNLQYNALSFVFLQIRELSWMQWHPFSVSSSPLDGKHHLSVLIKVLGQWTMNLRGNIMDTPETEPEKEPPFRPHTMLTASVEGPYGHESPYHLMYENLILVAGGIGLSPFVAILRDILHRVREGKTCLPRNILIIWAVRRSNELSLLSTIAMESICPFFSGKLNIETRIYVTRESEPPLEEGKVQNAVNSYLCPMPKSCGMSVLVGTGHKVWSGLYIISSTVGFIILMGLLDIFYINPYSIYSWWYKGLLFMVCMAASIVIFGGFVIGLWHLYEKRTSAEEGCEEGMINVDKAQHDETVTGKNLHWDSCTSIQYGSRPDFAEIFYGVSKDWGHVDVGVIVCGPPTLQSSVAKEIRSHNLNRQCHYPIFHFNCHSFDL
ncbi:hypothetical protein FNV43_RR18927 [Rhamnella rubrinervis]|uniref:ferric-chelate reductase (NADH) n=1 Tax=Rhamnella rubrinervis TaxID=2594499 RepID=A0A8K0E623_9ROSA|nr:hypothetical protein FNV43_RR18927 [Rhamnella rubrinervis]